MSPMDGQENVACFCIDFCYTDNGYIINLQNSNHN